MGASAAATALFDAPVEVGGAIPKWVLLSDGEVDAYWAMTKQQRHDDKDPKHAAAVTTGDVRILYGVVLGFDGAGAAAEREIISKLCGRYGEVAFVDYQHGEESGYVRFRQPRDASAALAGTRSPIRPRVAPRMTPRATPLSHPSITPARPDATRRLAGQVARSPAADRCVLP